MLKRSVGLRPIVLLPLTASILQVMTSDIVGKISAQCLSSCHVQIGTYAFQYYNQCHFMLECGDCHKEKGKLSVVMFFTYTYKYKLIF